MVVPLANQTVTCGQSVQLKCEVDSSVYPTPSVTWSHDGIPLSIDRAFTNVGDKICVLKINDVQSNDEGVYVCTISNKMGVVSSEARITVLGE